MKDRDIKKEIEIIEEICNVVDIEIEELHEKIWKFLDREYDDFFECSPGLDQFIWALMRQYLNHGKREAIKKIEEYLAKATLEIL